MTGSWLDQYSSAPLPSSLSNFPTLSVAQSACRKSITNILCKWRVCLRVRAEERKQREMKLALSFILQQGTVTMTPGGTVLKEWPDLQLYLLAEFRMNYAICIATVSFLGVHLLSTSANPRGLGLLILCRQHRTLCVDELHVALTKNPIPLNCMPDII